MFSSPWDRVGATIKPEIQLFTGRMESLRSSKNRSFGADVDGEEKKLYTCKICSNDYDSETELESHKSKTHGRYLYLRSRIHRNTCRVCRKIKKNDSDLLKHIKTVHLLSTSTTQYIERDIFICDHCNRVFFNKRMLIIHITRHYQLKTNPECPKCFRRLRRRNTFMMHLELHYINSVGTCPICFFKFQDRNTMLTHVFNTHKMVYNCTVCNYAFEKMSAYVRHMDIEHSKPADFESCLSVTNDVVKRCFVSGKRGKTVLPIMYIPYTAAKGLNIAGLIHICILCRAICTTEAQQREHISRMHLQPIKVKTKKIYGCACGENFYNNVLLKHHIFTLKGTHCVRPELSEIKVEEEKAVIFASDDSDQEIVDPIAITNSESSQELPEMNVEEDIVRVIEICDVESGDNDETVVEVVVDNIKDEDEIDDVNVSADDERLVKESVDPDSDMNTTLNEENEVETY